MNRARGRLPSGLNARFLCWPALALALGACSGTSSSTSTAGGLSSGGSAPSTSGGGSPSTSGGVLGDTTAGSGPPTQGSLCQISILDSPGGPGDPCAAVGLACNLDAEGYDHCTLPQLGQDCSPAVGCGQPDNICFDSGGTASCVQGCLATTDCADPATVCAATDAGQACLPNLCGPPLYAACDSAGAGDGACLPVQTTSGGAEGLCFGAGPAALNEPCSTSRRDGGALCVAGAQCVLLANGASFCAPICAVTAVPDAGKGSFPTVCSGSGLCLSLGGAVDFGACLVDCTKGEACPGNLQCAPDATTAANGASVSLCL